MPVTKSNLLSTSTVKSYKSSKVYPTTLVTAIVPSSASKKKRELQEINKMEQQTVILPKTTNKDVITVLSG